MIDFGDIIALIGLALVAISALHIAGIWGLAAVFGLLLMLVAILRL